MNTNRTGHYEAMFLVGAENAQANWEKVETHVRELIERRGGKIRLSNKWEERKLAFSIMRQTRGVYYLTYFELPRRELATLRRDCQLSELILRVLFLALETVPDYETLPARQAAKQELIRKLTEEREREREEEEGRERYRGGGGGGGYHRDRPYRDSRDSREESVPVSSSVVSES